MSDTLLTSTLPPSTLQDVAHNLSESPQAVTRGFELSSAALLSRLAYRTDDTSAMRQVIDTASRSPGNVLTSDFSRGLPSPQNAPWLANAQAFAGSLFGTKQQEVINSISRESGLKATAAATVFTLGAQSVLERLGARVRQDGMTASSLATYLQNERQSLRNALPAGLQGLVSTTPATSSPVMAQVVETDPVIAQTVRKERSILPWLLLGGLVLLGLLWYFLRPHPAPTVAVPPVTAPAAPNLGAFVQKQLPGGPVLNVPENGVEGRLLAFIQDPNRAPDTTSWFDFDRLLFDTGSATLQPASQEQLGNIAAILKAYPNVHLKIGGYTDNVGSPDSNLTLSQARATNVMNELIRMGISPDRLEAKGYGEDHPVADNSTEAGRALNRRISMLVTQK